MRYALPMILLLMTSVAPALAADDTPPAVSLYRSGEKELTAEAKSKLADWSVELLKTANFNTANQPDTLGQTVTHIQQNYRKTVMGDYLVITWDHAITVKTVGGEVSVNEIIVGLNRPDDFPSSLFTVDPDGRIVAHEKYGLRLPAELRPRPTP